MNNTIRVVALFMVFAIFINIATAQQASRDQLMYIDTYKGIAIYEMDRTSIPASITLAQGLLESRHGTSMLAMEGKNHFGIKCGANWFGETIYISDDDRDHNGNIIPSCFREFSTVEESFVAHSDFLKNPHKSRYDFLFDLELTDYKGWAHGLKSAGYASDPKYPSKLINLIERYNLQQYDKPQLASPPVVNSPPRGRTPVQMTYLHINNLPCVLAKGGESIETIAAYANVSVRRLLHYNDNIYNANQILLADQIVFLKPKKRNNSLVANSHHRVGAGETMVSISQEYGILLLRLYQKNRMNEGMEPAVGSYIKLSGNRVASRPALETGEELVGQDEQDDYMWSDESTATTQAPLVLPETPPSYGTPVNQKATAEKCEIYVVKKGDTLYGISITYDIAVATLKEKNNLSNNVISIGQEIVVSGF